MGKNFMRTKDDPFQSDFYSADHFGSTMEPNISHFMGALGNPAGDGYVTYTNGTKVTDALLNFRYYLAARNNGYSGDNLVLPLTSTRPDWQHTKTVAQTKLVNIKENKEQLPVAFAANRDIINFRSLTLDPLFAILAAESGARNLMGIVDVVEVHVIEVLHLEEGGLVAPASKGLKDL